LGLRRRPRSKRRRVVFWGAAEVCWTRNAREGTVRVAVVEAGVTKKRSGRVRRPAERAWTVTVGWALDSMAVQECHNILNFVDCSKVDLVGVQLLQNRDRAVDSRRRVNGPQRGSLKGNQRLQVLTVKKGR
jgi:hypothetical protein